MTAIPAATTAPATTATTVKAWRFTRGGPPAQALRLDEDLPMPSLPPPASLLSRTSPGEGWVLVKVAYTGLNPGTQFQFNILPAFARAATCVPELDFCGTVVDVWTPGDDDDDDTGAGDSTSVVTTITGDAAGTGKQPAKNAAAGIPQPQRFAKNDLVVGFLPITYSYPTGDGALASYIRVPARYVVKIPSTGKIAGSVAACAISKSSSSNDDGTTLKQFAGLMCATCTAIMLVDEAKLRRGHSVLVVGASGGVGTAAVQLARSIVGTSGDSGDGNGGRVVAVCSGSNAELVKGLGADEVIDYTQHPDLSGELTRRFGSDSDLGPFDAILDCHGNQAVYVRSAAYLRAPDYVACSGEMASWSFGHFLAAFLRIQSNTYWPMSRWLGGVGRRFRLVAMMDPGRELMERAAGLVGDGTVKVCEDSVWGYRDVLGAYEVLVAGRAKGKILVKWD